MRQEYADRGIVHKLTKNAVASSKLIVHSNDSNAKKLIKYSTKGALKASRAAETTVIFTKDAFLNKSAGKEFHINLSAAPTGKTKVKIVREDTQLDKNPLALKRLDESLSRRFEVEDGASKPNAVSRLQSRAHRLGNIQGVEHNIRTTVWDATVTVPLKAHNFLGDASKRGLLHAVFKPNREEIRFKNEFIQDRVEARGERRSERQELRATQRENRIRAIDSTVSKLTLSHQIDKIEPKSALGKGLKQGVRAPIRLTEKVTLGTVKLVTLRAVPAIIKNAPFAAETAVMTVKNTAVNAFTSRLGNEMRQSDVGNMAVTVKDIAAGTLGLIKTVEMHKDAKRKACKLKTESLKAKLELKNTKASFKAAHKQNKADIKAKRSDVKAAKVNIKAIKHPTSKRVSIKSAKIKAKSKAAHIKSDSKLSKADKKIALKKNKAELKANKAAIKRNKPNSKKSAKKYSKDKVTEEKIKVKRAKFEAKKAKKLDTLDKKLTVKLAKKKSSAAKKAYKANKPIPFALTLSLSAIGKGINKGIDKALAADANNDFTKAARIVKGAVDKAAPAVHKAHKKRKTEKKPQKKQRKLHKKENKLTAKKSKLQKKKHTSKTRVESVKAKIKKTAKAAAKTAASCVKFFFGFMAGMIIPLLIIIIVLVIFLLIFAGGAENNTYILGTYNCSDETIAQAIEAYTKIAYDFNENVMKANSTSTWKTGLNNLGVDTSDKKNTPTTITYGGFDGYTAGDYDFEAERLIAFLCAYTYDFSNVDSDTDIDVDSTTDIPIWKWNSACETAVEALFYNEYEFACKYNDASTWLLLDDYYQPYGNDFISVANWGTHNSDIGYFSFDNGSQLFKSTSGFNLWKNTYIGDFAYYDDSTGKYKIYFALNSGTDADGNSYSENEVLNGGNTEGIYTEMDFRKTGWEIQLLDTTYKITHSDGTTSSISSFLKNITVTTGGSITTIWGFHNRSYSKAVEFSPWYTSDLAMYRLLTPELVTAFYDDGTTYSQAGTRFFQKQYYNKECELYTCVVQNKTFDEAIQEILGAMDNADARISYYLTIMGEASSGTDTDTDTDSHWATSQTTYNRGNHQVFASPLSTDMTTLVENDSIYNDYGYDIQAWNETHCGVAERQSTSGDSHIGIDIEASAGDNVYAMFDGEIIEYNENIGAITLKSSEKITYWYLDKEYWTRAAYCNVTIKSDIFQKLKNGETVTVSAGDLLGTVNSNHYCVSDISGIFSKTFYMLIDNVSCDYLNISIEVEKASGWTMVYPSFLIY